MKKLILFFGVVLCFTSLSAQEWILSHTNTPYVAAPTGNIPIGDQYGMVMKGNTVCYAGGSGGWVTTDLGANWTKVLTNSLTISAVAIHPTTNDIYFAKTKTNDTCFIVKSSNNGTDFTTIKKAKLWGGFSDIVVTNIGTILAFTGSNMMESSVLYRSENNGVDWTEIPFSFTTATQVKVYGDTILMIGKGSYAGLYYSVDDGRTFTKKVIITSSARNAHAVCKAPNGDIYVSAYPASPSTSTKGEIYKSTDFGNTWSVVYAAQTNFTPIYDIEALSNGEIYACMLLSGIIKSVNNGSSWDLAISDGQMELGVGANGKIHGVKNGYLCYLGSSATGLEVTNQSSVYSIYPNPATDELTIANISRPTKYELISTMGEVVQSNTTNGKINVHELATGIYFLRFDQTTLKILKK